MVIQPNLPPAFGCDLCNSSCTAENIDENAPFGHVKMFGNLRNNPSLRPYITKAQGTLSIPKQLASTAQTL
jgi:hypothetical protein